MRGLVVSAFGFRGSGFQGYRGFGLGVLRCRVQGFRVSGFRVSGFRVSELRG